METKRYNAFMGILYWKCIRFIQTKKQKPSRKITPSKLSPSKLSPSKLSPSKLSPSKLSPSKMSPSKLSPSKLSPSKYCPLRNCPLRNCPLRNYPLGNTGNCSKLKAFNASLFYTSQISQSSSKCTCEFLFIFCENLVVETKKIQLWKLFHVPRNLTPVELPYISCKNLSDFTSKILEDNALFSQVSWKILEDNVWSCKILQENVWSCKILQENI